MRSTHAAVHPRSTHAGGALALCSTAPFLILRRSPLAKRPWDSLEEVESTLGSVRENVDAQDCGRVKLGNANLGPS